jgi:hypothetical protein
MYCLYRFFHYLYCQQAAGHLPPFMFTEDYIPPTRPEWLEELAELGEHILDGVLRLLDSQHVWEYFRKVSQVSRGMRCGPGRGPISLHT